MTSTRAAFSLVAIVSAPTNIDGPWRMEETAFTVATFDTMPSSEVTAMALRIASPFIETIVRLEDVDGIDDSITIRSAVLDQASLERLETLIDSTRHAYETGKPDLSTPGASEWIRRGAGRAFDEPHPLDLIAGRLDMDTVVEPGQSAA